jgi:hypothetical protein
MSTPSRLNIIGFGVLFVASAVLSIYALVRPRDGAAQSSEPAVSAAQVDAVERAAETPQETTAPVPPPVPTLPVVAQQTPPDPAAGVVVAALDGLGGWASQGFSNSDPRFAQVADAVRGHLPVAIDHWRASRGDSYVDEAMARAILLAIRAEDRDVVLDALVDAPWLVAAVEPQGWAAVAHESLRRRLADEDQRLPQPAIDWAMACASAAGPADHALLARVLMRLPFDSDQQRLVERMRKMPGCDWQAAVQQAWDGRSTDGSPEAHVRLALLAAQNGSRDALITIGAMVAKERWAREQAQAWLATQPATGGVQRPPEWFAQRRDQLLFRDGAWVLGEVVPAAAPVVREAQSRLPAPLPDPPILPLLQRYEPGSTVLPRP